MATTIDGSASVTINSGAVLGITSGTAVASTSGTSIDFTGIPSWVKRVTIAFYGVSTNGTSPPQIQLGAGSVTTSGYSGTNAVVNAAPGVVVFSTGFGIGLNTGTWSAAITVSGSVTLTAVGSNVWTCAGVISRTDGTAWTFLTSGSVGLSGVLDRVRLTTANGTDTFDAGTINILYE